MEQTFSRLKRKSLVLIFCVRASNTHAHTHTLIRAHGKGEVVRFTAPVVAPFHYFALGSPCPWQEGTFTQITSKLGCITQTRELVGV